MARIPSRAAWAAFALLLPLVSAIALWAEEPKPIEVRPVANLIRMLGSNLRTERDAATRVLKARDEALPGLRKAAQSTDAETRRRAKEIIAAIMNRRLATYLEYGRTGRIDVMTEWLGQWDGSLDNDAIWEGVLGIAWELANRSGLPQQKRKDILKNVIWDMFCTSYKRSREILRPYSAPDFRINPEQLENHPELGSVVSMVCGHRALSGRSANGSFIVNAGPVKLWQISGCIIFANDDVTIDDGNSMISVVVTDGSFHSRGGSDDVVVARKDINYTFTPPKYSLLHAGGRVTMIQRDPKFTPPGNIIKEHTQRPLDFVRFFETTDLGLDIAMTKAGVAVAKLTAESPLAKAGIKVGDVIVSVDGIKSPDGEALRRQLRRAFVQDVATIAVRRGDKLIDLDVTFYGFKLPTAK